MEKKTILAVGMTSTVARDLAKTLQPIQVTVKTAPDVHAGFTLFCAETFDLVVSDADLEGDSAFEFMARIKAFSPDKPIVLLVGDDKKTTPQEIYDMGANAVLQKPLSLEHLARAIGILFTKGEEHWSTRSDRLKADLPIELEYLSTGTYLTTITINIGRGGLFVYLEPSYIPPEHSLISFKINASKPRVIEIKGEAIVRWTRREKGALPTGIGIEFIVLEDDSRNQVINLTEKLKREKE